jgi:DNA polymerase-3 subunit epsilon
MLKNVSLDMPLVVFDLETTGVDVKKDRIVELGVSRFEPGCDAQSFCMRFDPGVPIPPRASQVHGIYDCDVVGCPTFERAAADLIGVFDGAALGGYNVKKFDGPMLSNHFAACGFDLQWSKRVVVDSMEIFHSRVKRDLSGALMFYCGEEHTGAHGAMSDVEATVKILNAQVARHAAPGGVSLIAAWAVDDGRVDKDGKFKWDGDVCRITFGKHSGTDVRELAVGAGVGFLSWMVKGDFPDDTKRVARDILAGRFPQKKF